MYTIFSYHLLFVTYKVQVIETYIVSKSKLNRLLVCSYGSQVKDPSLSQG